MLQENYNIINTVQATEHCVTFILAHFILCILILLFLCCCPTTFHYYTSARLGVCFPAVSMLAVLLSLLFNLILVVT